MKRALIALFLTPAIATFVFGVLAILAIPFVFAMTLLVALPLFLFFYSRTPPWLHWGHAVLGGMLCGGCFAAFETSNLDHLISSNNVHYVGFGAAVGLAFWWTGIFRNPAFPSVGNKIPRSMVLVLPIALGLFQANHALRQTFYTGRVVAVLDRPTATAPKGHVNVRLSEGKIVQADFGDTWPISMIEGKCVHVQQRWSTLRTAIIYELNGPFGGNVDAC